MDQTMFYIAIISLVLMGALLAATISIKAKNTLKLHFIAYLIELFVWTFSVVAQYYCAVRGYTSWIMFFENTTYIGVSLIPVSVFIVGKTFYDAGAKKTVNPIVFYILPLITQIVIWTNPLHNLFFTSYDYFDKAGTQVGLYFYVHTVYSYGFLLIGTLYTFLFALRSKGRMRSRLQAVLICTGTIIPLITNMLYTLGISGFNRFSTPISFMTTLITFFLLIFRYNILRITPIVMKTVIDKTSDLYIVVDENMAILDYNEPFYNIFSKLIHFEKSMPLNEAMQVKNDTGVDVGRMQAAIEECRNSGEMVYRDLRLDLGGEVKYFKVEFSPLIIDMTYRGCLLLLRDITRAMMDMEEIKNNQNKLIKQERLASLGQLIGGIAHNLKTPIMAISGRAECLSVLIDEYEESICDDEITSEDHKEIAGEMRQEIEKIRSHMSYISDIITTVKDQAVKLNVGAGIRDFFTIGELKKSIDILMKHELMSHNCTMVYDIQINEDFGITGGDINSLVQIIVNILVNAIQAYEGKHGQIRFKISKTANDVIFTISDDAGGIPEDIQDKLFQQMITSKGKDGTGLGLYISYSTVIGMFEGRMWFESVKGKGTDFFVSIPIKDTTAGGTK